ncbi:MAG: hypothetical protein WC341_11480 [Bacteroidales bacterium]
MLAGTDLAMQEMKRVLKDNGLVIIPTYCHGANLKAHLLSRLMVLGLPGFKARSRWSFRTFRDFVKRNGFRIISDDKIHGPIPLLYLIAEKDKRK